MAVKCLAPQVLPRFISPIYEGQDGKGKVKIWLEFEILQILALQSSKFALKKCLSSTVIVKWPGDIHRKGEAKSEGPHENRLL